MLHSTVYAGQKRPHHFIASGDSSLEASFSRLKVSIDGDQTEQLVRLLDSFVIMLEGGAEFDLLVRTSKRYLDMVLSATPILQ